jgi:hypothetical protein
MGFSWPRRGAPKMHDTIIENFDPGSGALHLMEARVGWRVDQLAVTSRWVLATMSIGTGSAASPDRVVLASDVGMGGGGGDNGGGGGGG